MTYSVTYRKPFGWCIVDATGQVVEGGFFSRAAAEDYLHAEYL